MITAIDLIFLSLQNHKNIHSNKKPYGCPILNCEYRCSDSSNVYKHIRQKHGNNFKYSKFHFEINGQSLMYGLNLLHPKRFPARTWTENYTF